LRVLLQNLFGAITVWFGGVGEKKIVWFHAFSFELRGIVKLLIPLSPRGVFSLKAAKRQVYVAICPVDESKVFNCKKPF
jgi:hypothetical protein